MGYTEEDIVTAFNDFMTKMAAGNNMYFPSILRELLVISRWMTHRYSLKILSS